MLHVVRIEVDDDEDGRGAIGRRLAVGDDLGVVRLVKPERVVELQRPFRAPDLIDELQWIACRAYRETREYERILRQHAIDLQCGRICQCVLLDISYDTDNLARLADLGDTEMLPDGIAPAEVLPRKRLVDDDD